MFHAIVRSLKAPGSGRDAAGAIGQTRRRFRTHDSAPRVLLCNSNLVGHWNNWDRFHELDRAGDDVRADDGGKLDLHWDARDLQGTYETFAAAAKKHFGGNLKGKLVVTGGMGAWAERSAGGDDEWRGVSGDDVDPSAFKRRVKTGYCDVMVTSLDEALRILKNAVRKAKRLRWVGGQLRGLDSRTGETRRGAGFVDGSDQRARSHRRIRAERNDTGCGAGTAEENPEEYKKRSMAAMAQHVQGMLDLQKLAR